MELPKERKIMSLILQNKDKRKYMMALNFLKDSPWTTSVHDILEKLTTDETIKLTSTDEEIVDFCMTEIKAQIVTLCTPEVTTPPTNG